MMYWKFNVNLSQDEPAKRSHSLQTSSNSSGVAPLSCVSLVNYFSCKTATTRQDPGRDTDQKTGNIDNWLQQVTEKNGARQEERKKKTEVQDMDITLGCDVQTEPICSRK